MEDPLPGSVGYLDVKILLQCCMCTKPVENPVQLDCIHNCCKACIATPDEGNLLCCKACQDLTNVTTVKENDFIRDLAENYKKFEDLSMHSHCSYCKQYDKIETDAVFWCKECSMLACTGCMREHDKFTSGHCPILIEDVRSAEDVLGGKGTRERKCSSHELLLDYACFDCKTIICCKCALQCEKDHHRFGLVHSKETKDHLARLKKETDDLTESVFQKCQRLISDRHCLISFLESARRSDVTELQRRKKVLLEVLSEACEAAETGVTGFYDDLTNKARDLLSSAESISKKAEYASAYCKSLFASTDSISTFQQQKLLISRLQSIDGKSGVQDYRLAEVGPAATGFVVNESTGSENGLKEMVTSWIGRPWLLTDDLLCAAERRRELRSQANMQAGCNSNESGADLDDHKTPNFEYITCKSFTADVQCSDIAVMPNGNLALAAMTLGFREYCIGGREQSRWEPVTQNLKRDIVSTVDCFTDGRIAAGLYKERSIAVLQRGPFGTGPMWIEHLRIPILTIEPYRLAVCSSGLAVTGPNYCSSQLVIVSYSDGLKPDIKKVKPKNCYTIITLALTRQSVVTGSKMKQHLGGGSEPKYLVTAFDYCGTPLWQKMWDKRVHDMCTAFSDRVLYLAFPDRVTVADTTTEGAIIRENVLVGHNLPTCGRISVGRAQGSVLAILDDQTMTVSLYFAEASS